MEYINPLNAGLNPIRHLQAFVGAHHILHVSRVRVKSDATKFRLSKLTVFRNGVFQTCLLKFQNCMYF